MSNRVQSVGILFVLVCLYVPRFEENVTMRYPGQKISEYDKLKQVAPKSSKSLYSPLARDMLKTSPSRRPRLTDKYLDRFIVVPEYKLLFCYQEKVGCSMFNHLFRMLRLLHPRMSTESNTAEAVFLSSDTWFRNTPNHHNLSKSDLEEMLQDPAWTKATFFRDPATRFLSAYRSKCVLKERSKGIDHCRESFGNPWLPWGTVSFQHALGQLDQRPDQVFGNEHFAPAGTFCGGLDGTLDFYDFVHQLTTPTAPDHIHRLFATILRVDSNTSDYLIQTVVKTGGTALDRDEELLRQYYPQGLYLKGSTTQRKGHNTGSNQDHVLQDSYRDDENLRIIFDRYGKDYDLFQLPKLSLAELQIAGV